MTGSKENIQGEAAAALITAPASGQGKSMMTAALARLHRNAGRTVRVFKHGPDYLDPMVLEKASGNPVYQLHPWMTGEAECRWRLADAAAHADVVLVEGSMGLFDGNPSSADLAIMAGLPALPVIDAAGMAQTFGAVAQGLAQYHPDLAVHDVIANRIGSARHGEMLAESLPAGIRLLGAVPRHDSMNIPDRHLGIVQADEIVDLDSRLDAAAALLLEAGLDVLPKTITLKAPAPTPPEAHLSGKRIAIARDSAFAFIYRANLDLLKAMGAELLFFSPLADEACPDADALWLPGGYPELHGRTLAKAEASRASIRGHQDKGRPILAECGGMMYCMESLLDKEGVSHPMLGLLQGQSCMANRLVGLGIQSMTLSSGTLRGHTFHHSRLETELAPVSHTRRQRFDSAGEAIYQEGALLASYFHSYFPSSPEATAAIFSPSGQPHFTGEDHA